MRSLPAYPVKGIARIRRSMMVLLALPLLIRNDIPVAVMSMPEEVRDAYKRVDDLLRTEGAGSMVRGEAHEGSDGTNWIAATLYRLNDHNPSVFAQYADETVRKHGAGYGATLRALGERVYARVRNESAVHGNALYSMLYADYILRVRVRAIDPPVRQSADNIRYEVTADVLDTLKGQTLPPMHGPGASRGRSFIRFAYLPGNYIDPEEISRDRDDVDFPYYKNDPEFSTTSGRFTMYPGQEAIVFLRYQEGSSEAEPALYLEPWASYNALPVIKGQVRDLNMIWSDKEITTYEEWKGRFMGLRGELVGGE